MQRGVPEQHIDLRPADLPRRANKAGRLGQPRNLVAVKRIA
jgi:hypothetical protein